MCNRAAGTDNRSQTRNVAQVVAGRPVRASRTRPLHAMPATPQRHHNPTTSIAPIVPTDPQALWAMWERDHAPATACRRVAHWGGSPVINGFPGWRIWEVNWCTRARGRGGYVADRHSSTLARLARQTVNGLLPDTSPSPAARPGSAPLRPALQPMNKPLASI